MLWIQIQQMLSTERRATFFFVAEIPQAWWIFGQSANVFSVVSGILRWVFQTVLWQKSCVLQRKQGANLFAKCRGRHVGWRKSVNLFAVELFRSKTSKTNHCVFRQARTQNLWQKVGFSNFSATLFCNQSFEQLHFPTWQVQPTSKIMRHLAPVHVHFANLAKTATYWLAKQFEKPRKPTCFVQVASFC